MTDVPPPPTVGRQLESASEKTVETSKSTKLHGRAFFESIGSPRLILAPMVDQSEFVWRILTRSFLPPTARQTSLLAYTPMFHARLFTENPKYRDQSFQPFRGSWSAPKPTSEISSSDAPHEPYLDGNTTLDRPLFVQFCANSPSHLLEAAQHVAPYCDAVDLNLGCPQGIARKGKYGAFLQESPDLIYELIHTLHKNLSVPVTAKFRILETKEKTLAYAKTILDAGASIITVHGRRREQKGHNTGIADWSYIRYLRDNLPADTVIIANGNILQHDDIQRCLDATGADGVMSAEGNLHDPGIFVPPPAVGEEGREYWRGRDGKGGYRLDAVMRRYLDIIYKYVLETPAPERKPLWIPSDPVPAAQASEAETDNHLTEEEEGPPRKKQRKDESNSKTTRPTSPNLTGMQAHMFGLLRHLVSVHTDIRDALARSRAGNMEAFENVLSMTEARIQQALIDYEDSNGDVESQAESTVLQEDMGEEHHETMSSAKARARCKRPWWVCQSYLRPLPEEALAKGSLQLSKKAKKEMVKQQELARTDKIVDHGVKVAG